MGTLLTCFKRGFAIGNSNLSKDFVSSKATHCQKCNFGRRHARSEAEKKTKIKNLSLRKKIFSLFWKMKLSCQEQDLPEAIPLGQICFKKGHLPLGMQAYPFLASLCTIGNANSKHEFIHCQKNNQKIRPMSKPDFILSLKLFLLIIISTSAGNIKMQHPNLVVVDFWTSGHPQVSKFIFFPFLASYHLFLP